jgi:hypothetical protein
MLPRKKVKSLLGVVALFVLALCLPSSARAESWFCRDGQLFYEYGGVPYWMGTEYSEGNMTWSCNGDRLHTVMIVN